MDAKTKAKYDKAKYLVKKWEKEFKKTTNQTPTKVDIKNAPSKVKEAYRTYWVLKTTIMENTLSDVLIDDNAKDCFNSSNENAEPQMGVFPLPEDSQCFKPINENSESVSQFSSLNFRNAMENSVWGKHLNKEPVPSTSKQPDPISFEAAGAPWRGVKAKAKLEPKEEDPSLKYAAKLSKRMSFSHLSKKNPLKRKVIPRAATESDLEKAKVEVVGYNSSYLEEREAALEVQNEKLTDSSATKQLENSDPGSEPDLSSMLNVKVVSKTKNDKNNSQAVSLLQKKLDGGFKSRFDLDKGWLERVGAATETKNSTVENISQDSGIELSQGVTLPLIFNDSDSDTVIYDSDAESQSQSQSISLVQLPKKSLKRSLTPESQPEPKRSKTEEPTVFKSWTTKPELIVTTQAATPAAPRLDDEKKIALLERKLKSGKANENFVSINIQKKVYVRGKKKMTFSKYKKQKWKDMKKEANERATCGIRKCFKCGDIGHFSKACPSGGNNLLPLEDYHSEDESPFPSLQEVEQMAKDEGDKAHKGIRKFTMAEVTEDVQQPILDDVENKIKSLGSSIQPVYPLNSDGSVIETTSEVIQSLREFGHQRFLPGQEKAVMRILSGKSTLVTLSTGSGKSLCYQLPAKVFAKHYDSSIALVVSPLVSLMDDQVLGLGGWDEAACLHTNMTTKKREATLDRIKSGEIKALLMSPEMLTSLECGSAKSLLKILPPIAFACIDEAHCLHQWCHNFRPSYLTVTQVLREKLGVKTLLGLTATASQSTIESLVKHLGIEPGDSDAVISDTPLPSNLRLSVSITHNDEEKQNGLVDLLTVGRFAGCSSVIIYCTRRETCDKVATFLRTTLQRSSGDYSSSRVSPHAEVYHAGLTPGRRNVVQNSFMKGKTRVVVATVAFGMGINKPDIQGVIHFSLPATFENYVQEVGRAGRDGQLALCHLFLDAKNKDLGELRRHIYSDTIDRHTIRKLLQSVFPSCNCTNCHLHEVAFPIETAVTSLDLVQENISTLLAYLELSERRSWIKVLPLAYTQCKVTSYKGPNHLKSVARKCPPLALAMAEAAKSFKTVTELNFEVVALSRQINWDSGVVKSTLKNLEWTTNEAGKSHKTGLMVQFSSLGFHVLAPGNLTESELDEALDQLHAIVLDHEKSRLTALQAFYDALTRVTYKNLAECEEATEEELVMRSDKLKTEIRTFFDDSSALATVELDERKIDDSELESVIRDIRQVIASAKGEHVLSGRVIARILHGIGSPNFPPIIWGRTRLWRAQIGQDFNALRALATKQLLIFR